MKFHEYVTAKLRAVAELQRQHNRRGADMIKKWSPVEYLKRKTAKLIEEFGPAIKTVFKAFDAETKLAYADAIDSYAFAAANTGIRSAVQVMVELEWFEINRPFYNVYPIVEKLVRNTKLDVPVAQLTFSPNVICFRFPAGQEPFGIKTAVLKTGFFETDTAKQFAPLFASPTNPAGDTKLFMAGSFSVVNEKDWYMVQIPDSLIDEIGGKTATVEHMLATMLKNWVNDDATKRAIGGRLVDELLIEDLPMYTQRIYFLFRLAVLTSLVAGGKDLITPAILASEQDKYDIEPDEAAKRWMEERAAKIQGRGFDFGKELQAKSELSPHWRNPHMALYWIGEGRTKPVLKLRAGSVVIPKHLSSVPTGYDCPIQDAPDQLKESNEHVYFLRDPSQGLVKIGRTRRSVEARQRESNTFVPGGLALLGYIQTGNCVELETRLHREYAHKRRDNEFFELSVDESRAIIESFGGIFCDSAA